VETSKVSQRAQLAAEKSNWSKALPAGQGAGHRLLYVAGSYLAHVAESRWTSAAPVRVRRVTSAVDCGTAVNPDGVRAMTEGGH